MAEPFPAIAYDTHETHRRTITPEWRLLRMIAMLWSAAVLYRHGTFWTGQLLDSQIRTTAFKSAGMLFRAAGETFPAAGLEAAAEAIILLATLVLAIRSRVESPRAARGFRILGTCFIVLVLADFVLNSTFAVEDSEGILRGALRITWMLVSKLQLLIVPFAMAVGLERFRPRPSLEGVTP